MREAVLAVPFDLGSLIPEKLWAKSQWPPSSAGPLSVSVGLLTRVSVSNSRVLAKWNDPTSGAVIAEAVEFRGFTPVTVADVADVADVTPCLLLLVFILFIL